MLLTNLHRFAHLPAELRCSIWRFALGQTHVHRLRIGAGPGGSQSQDQDQNHSLVLYPAETLPSSTATTRNILSTCIESRMEAIRALPDSLPLFFPSPNTGGGCYTLLFNARKDVICLAELEPDAVGAVTTLLRDPPPNQKKDDLQWLKQLGSVKSLAIDVRNMSFVYDYRELGRRREELAVLPSFLAAFAGLEWLFLVPWPSPDERATLVCDPNLPHDDKDEDEDDEEEAEEQQEGIDQTEGEDEVVEAEDGNLQPQVAGAVSHTNDVRSRPISGDWLRGENGLSDWYRWVPKHARWGFSDSIVRWHFEETTIKANELRKHLINPRDALNLTSDEKKRLASVRVEVMVHFRERRSTE